MIAAKQTINADKLQGIIDLPEDLRSRQVEVTVSTVDEVSDRLLAAQSLFGIIANDVTLEKSKDERLSHI